MKNFVPEDAIDLINQHKKVFNVSTKIIKKYGTAKLDIKKIAESCICFETSKILQTISVDELSNYKSGLKIKTLKDNNINTFADLEKVSTITLIDINGISEESALLIKKVFDDIYQNIKKDMKLKLNADDKNDYSTELIKAIYIYKHNYQPIKEIKHFYSQNYNLVNGLIDTTMVMASNVKWFFTSKAKKQTALSAFDKLQQLIKTETFVNIQQTQQQIENNYNASKYDLWADFVENNIEYFTTLEDIVPDLISKTESDIKGLPEELAQNISNVNLNLLGLNCTLRKYQELGVKYILHQKNVLLGDEMGLGKTIQAIASMVCLKNSGETHFLVICPASVLTNWQREVEKHSDLTAIKIHGTDKIENLNIWLQNGGVGVTTYETTANLRLPEDFKISLLIVDEAHYIKNPDAKRTKNTKKICKKCERILFMTGTALENRVDEMISLISILQPQIALSIRNITYMAHAQKFREKVSPVYFRRKRSDVLTELPELIESEEWCEISKEEEFLYENAILDKHYANARRVSWNVDDLNNSSKAQRLLEILEEAEDEERKVIVFSFFLDTIQKIALLLQDKCYGPITGEIPPQRRQEIIDEFDDAPDGSVLVAQIQSGGTGLNIQSASVVVICEPQFKPSIENQAISRSYRMGQARNVLVYRLLAEDTIDEQLNKLLKDKQKVFDAFADKSLAAQLNMEIDENTFNNLIEEETARINKKRELMQNT